MSRAGGLTRREAEVASLLLQGKSNKQIALALGISEHTVEFHLKNIYRKLGVCSRGEAIVELGKSVGAVQQKPGESGVAGQGVALDNQGSSLTDATPLESVAHARPSGRPPLPRLAFWAGAAILLVLVGMGIVLVLALSRPEPWTSYTRECENPEMSTVGRTLNRSSASNLLVHGQFGVEDSPPWAARPGYVIYKDIRTPALDQVFLKLRYSKNSPASTPILIFIDDEAVPRNRLMPMDQHDWNHFAWSETVSIGALSSGVHSLELFTEGQQYGVADLDQLILSR